MFATSYFVIALFLPIIFLYTVTQSGINMRTFISIRTLSLGAHVLALNSGPSAAIHTSSDTITTATQATTIMKRIVHTEVRSMATAFLWPYHNTSNASPEASILDLHNTSGGDAENSMGTQLSRPILPNNAVAYTINKRSTSLYHLKIDLAAEGYISVYMPNNTASLFCNTEGDIGDGDKERPYPLNLIVRNPKQTVSIPVGDDVANDFCTVFTAAEAIGEGNGQKATKSANAKSTNSKSESGKTSLIESVASEGSTALHSSTSLHSSTMTKSSQTCEITDSSDNTSSVKQKATHGTSSDTGPIDTDSASTPKPKSVTSEDNSGETQSGPHKTSKTKPSYTMSPETETSSVHSSKSKSRTSEAQDTGDLTELTASIKKQYTQTTSTEAISTSTTVVSVTGESEPSSSRTANINKVTSMLPPANAFGDKDLQSSFASSLTELTKEVPHLNIPSYNTWYGPINSYLATAAISADDEDVISTPVSTATSTNGAAGKRRAAATRAAIVDAQERNVPQLIQSINSWFGRINNFLLTAQTTPQSESTMTTRGVTSDPSSNAAIRRATPPSMLWHRTTPAVDTKRTDNGPGEKADQEMDHYFKIGEEESTKTKSKLKTSSVGKGGPLATKLAGEDAEVDEQVEDEAPQDDAPTAAGGGAVSTIHTPIAADEDLTLTEDTPAIADAIEEALPMDGAPIEVPDGVTSTEAEPTATEEARTGADEDATPSEAMDKAPADDEPNAAQGNDSPPEDNEAPPEDDAPPPEETTDSISSTKAKSKSKHPHTTEAVTTKASRTVSESHIPTLDPSIEFAFASESRSMPTPALPTTISPLPTPPQGPATASMGPIIWDPECPHISTSTSTAPNGATSLLPKTVGLGCWRTLPPTVAINGTEHSTAHLLQQSSAWHVLNDKQNAQIRFFCWFILGLGLWCFVTKFVGLSRGEWHTGQKFVWWALKAEWIHWWILGEAEGIRKEYVRKREVGEGGGRGKVGVCESEV